MNTFEWGRMNEEDVHLDYYTIRTFSVIRFRSLHTRLAVKLVEEGKREKALEVLDRCMELAPSHVLPFDEFISGITLPNGEGDLVRHEGVIEAYYLCGEMEKGNAILREHYQTLSEELLFMNSMKPRHRGSIQREINEVLYQLEEMNFLMQQYGQTDLMMELGVNDSGLPPMPIQ
jgi:hypothetical protein